MIKLSQHGTSVLTITDMYLCLQLSVYFIFYKHHINKRLSNSEFRFSPTSFTKTGTNRCSKASVIGPKGFHSIFFLNSECLLIRMLIRVLKQNKIMNKGFIPNDHFSERCI